MLPYSFLLSVHGTHQHKKISGSVLPAGIPKTCLMEENNKNSLQFRDSINAFLKEYNKTHGYSLIFSNTGFDNLLYADSAFNITEEIVNGLNARYSPVKK